MKRIIPSTLILFAASSLVAAESTNTLTAVEATNSTVAAVATQATNAPSDDPPPTSTEEPSTADSAARTGIDFKTFKIITERNIFDANRTGGNRSERRRPERVVKIDTLKLLGTISYERGRFAFFDGSSSQYRKTLQTADDIAGYRIAEIAYDHVKLATTDTNSTPIVLCVGMQMRRQDEGSWSLDSRSATSPSSTSASIDTGQESSSGSDDAENEVMKRLMKKREKELTK